MESKEEKRGKTKKNNKKKMQEWRNKILVGTKVMPKVIIWDSSGERGLKLYENLTLCYIISHVVQLQ